MTLPKPSKEELEILMKEHKTIAGIGRAIGVSKETVKKWFIKNSLPIPTLIESKQAISKSIAKRFTKEELETMLSQHNSMQDLARTLGLKTSHAVFDALTFHGIPHPSAALSQQKYRSNPKPVPPKIGNYKSKICIICNKNWTPKLQYQTKNKTCSRECANKLIRKSKVVLDNISKEQLIQMLNEYGSMGKLAKHLNVSYTAVRNYFIRHSIQTPNAAESYYALSKSIPIRMEAQEIIDGLIGSDGNIENGVKGNTARFRLNTPFEEYTSGVVNALQQFLPITYSKHADNRTATLKAGRLIKTSTGFRCVVTTPFTKEFNEQYRRWYPNGKKIVPRDIPNTPAFWKWLYIGDGSISQKNKSMHYLITICTEGFTKEDVEFLVSLLAQHDIESKVYMMYQKYPRLLIGTDSRKFLNFIGPCPIPFFQYKWDIKNVEPRACVTCNTMFTPKHNDKLYCSRRCYPSMKYIRKADRKTSF